MIAMLFMDGSNASLSLFDVYLHSYLFVKLKFAYSTLLFSTMQLLHMLKIYSRLATLILEQEKRGQNPYYLQVLKQRERL